MKKSDRNLSIFFLILIIIFVIIFRYILIYYNPNIYIEGYCSNIDRNNLTVDYATYCFLWNFTDNEIDFILNHSIKIVAFEFVENKLLWKSIERIN